jgi:hypothetical protein
MKILTATHFRISYPFNCQFSSSVPIPLIGARKYIFGLELQRFEFVSFPKIYIWDLGVRFGFFFRDHVIQISFRLMNFQDIYSELGKATSFLETFTPSIQILIFMEQLCTVQYIQYEFFTEQTTSFLEILNSLCH